jgi:hypothetical protein
MTIYKYDVIISVENLMISENYDVKAANGIIEEIMLQEK